MPADSRADLQTEIAATAARMIAEEGLDYASAKRKAAEELTGGIDQRALPDNPSVERELRRYLGTFDPDHPARLAALRSQALVLMDRLAPFNPHLVGAVLNGTATAHSNLHLHLFTDSAKDVELFLMDARIDFEVDEPAGRRGEPGAAMEELSFVVPVREPTLAPRLGVVLSVHPTDAIRVAPRGRSADPELHPVETSGRAARAALQTLVDAARGPA